MLFEGPGMRAWGGGRGDMMAELTVHGSLHSISKQLHGT